MLQMMGFEGVGAATVKWHHRVYYDTKECGYQMDHTTRQGYRQHQHLLQRELGAWAAGLELSLTPVHQRIVHTLDWLDVQTLLG